MRDLFEGLLFLSAPPPSTTSVLQRCEKEIRIDISDNVSAPVKKFLYACVHGVGELVTQGNSVWGWPGNRQYYGCMSISRTVLSFGSMHGRCRKWRHAPRDSPPLETRPYCPFIQTSVHRENFLYTDKSCSFRSMLTGSVAVRTVGVESKNQR